MKAVLASLVLAGLTMATPAPAAPAASTSGASNILTGPTIPNGHDFRKRIALRDLSREGREMQAADGGKLTQAHRAYLQGKLDAINAGNY
jgi:hypothetical protein